MVKLSGSRNSSLVTLTQFSAFGDKFHRVEGIGIGAREELKGAFGGKTAVSGFDEGGSERIGLEESDPMFVPGNKFKLPVVHGLVDREGVGTERHRKRIWVGMREIRIEREDARLAEIQLGPGKADLFSEACSGLDEYVRLEESKVACGQFGGCRRVKRRIGPGLGDGAAYRNDRVEHASPQAGADLENAPERFHVGRIDEEANAGWAKAE